MAASKPVEQAAKSIVRSPAAIGSAALTLFATALYLAPSLGIKVPDGVARLANIAMTVGSAFGAVVLVKPK